ncbi:hypothetical protein GCM10010377_48460 [Streptomyces viridiviolaceus]|nr:hypothetical protein GCM10010377_48460 [Streptomyces viridiviolaceus]
MQPAVTLHGEKGRVRDAFGAACEEGCFERCVAASGGGSSCGGGAGTWIAGWTGSSKPEWSGGYKVDIHGLSRLGPPGLLRWAARGATRSERPQPGVLAQFR